MWTHYQWSWHPLLADREEPEGWKLHRSRGLASTPDLRCPLKAWAASLQTLQSGGHMRLQVGKRLAQNQKTKYKEK